MADKDDKTPNTFEGFEALSNQLISGPGSITGDTVIDPDDVKKAQDDIIDDDAGDTGDGDTNDDDTGDGDTGDTDDGDTGDGDDGDGDTGDGKTGDGDTGDSITPDDFSEVEGELTNLFKDKLGEELDWEFTEDDKFESMKDLVDYMKNVVTESSKPVYANDEMERLNSFVADGGNLRDFFDTTTPGELDLENIDMEDVSNQKNVLREYLKTRGFKEDRIQKNINRYEDADVLDEEAEDAVELLKEYKTKQTETLLSNQKNQADSMKVEQQKFMTSVEEEVKGLEDIRGFKISKEQKKDLLEYIFKPTPDSKTAYQKQYADNAVRNLIESAFFTKNGEVFIDKIKKKASSDAYEKIRKKLKASKGKRNINTGGQGGSGGSDSFKLLSKNLLS